VSALNFNFQLLIKNLNEQFLRMVTFNAVGIRKLARQPDPGRFQNPWPRKSLPRGCQQSSRLKSSDAIQDYPMRRNIGIDDIGCFLRLAGPQVV
jgi:hypothetical protein